MVERLKEAGVDEWVLIDFGVEGEAVLRGWSCWTS